MSSNAPNPDSGDTSTQRGSRARSRPKKPGPWFGNGFHRFLAPYLRKHFDTVAIDRETRWHPEAEDPRPLIVFANHPSWWDPLIAQFLNRVLFAPREFYAPIDADALQQYKVFEKLGFYGVKMSSKAGAADFLKTSSAIMNHPNTAIWITPEGRFADPRDHSADLMPGLAHLCQKRAAAKTSNDCRNDAVVLPLALEYAFWNERLPVCLASHGTPFFTDEHTDWSKADWSRQLTIALRDAQTRLKKLSIGRSSEPFEPLLRGKRGGGWMYDTARRIKSLISGQSFKAAHGESFE